MKYGLFVDLSGMINPPPPNVECHIFKSDYIDCANRVTPVNKKVLLSIKNFPDDYESYRSGKVKEIVECISIVAEKMNDIHIFINCRSGVNRSPLISARFMAYRTDKTNKPCTMAYNCYEDLSYMYCKEIESFNNKILSRKEFDVLLPSEWPKICIADWTQSEICMFGRREIKYPNNNLGMEIPKSICITMDMGDGDIDMEDAHDERSFFSPSEVPEELARGSRTCVQACLALLGYEEDIRDITPSNDPNCVHWFKVLESVCPNAVVHHFNSAEDLAKLPSTTLDRLILATVNKVQRGANHAMVIWKSGSNTCSNEVELFDPGNLTCRWTVDIDKERTTAKWNTICAAFLPETTIEKDNASSPIEV